MRLLNTTAPPSSRPATLKIVFPRSMPRTATTIRMLLLLHHLPATIAAFEVGRQFIPLGHQSLVGRRDIVQPLESNRFSTLDVTIL